MLKYLVALFILISSSCAADTVWVPPVLYVSIPKTGTHLVAKCVTLFGRDDLVYHYEKVGGGKIKTGQRPRILCLLGKLNTELPPNNYKGALNVPHIGVMPTELIRDLESNNKNRFSTTHWPYTAEFADYLKSKSIQVIFSIRDPRDVLVSLAFMVSKSVERGKSIDPVLVMNDFIDARQENYIHWGVEEHQSYPLVFDKGITGFMSMYLGWLSHPGVCLIRFEDLVGEKGGGSDAAQVETIQRLASFLNIDVDDKKIKYVQENLFGGSGTFRDGQIGGWKKYFTPEMKAAFKAFPGACQLLIDLGYEVDCDW